jgi:hypothetical protein
MSPAENKALVRRFYEAIDAGDLAAMDDLVAEDYVNHHPPPFPGLAGGREGLKQAFEIFWAGQPRTSLVCSSSWELSPCRSRPSRSRRIPATRLAVRGGEPCRAVISTNQF